MRLTLRHALPLAALAVPAFATGAKAALCDPMTYGAAGDGAFDNTTPLQQAINACAAGGGGVVRLSGAGSVFLTGPINLASHVYLQIDPGVVLRSVSDKSRFTVAFVGYTYDQSAAAGSSAQEALVSGVNITNSGIIGGGTIDGQGSQLFWTDAINTKTDITNNPSALNFSQLATAAAANTAHPPVGPVASYAGYGNIPTSNGLPRPWLVEFYNSQNITVSGITLVNPPMWHLALRYCNGVNVTNYTVNDPSTSPNTDGVDIVASNNVVVSNVNIADGDDNIAIKSGFPGFATPAVPATNILISNATLGVGHGLSVGSEADNGVQHLRVNGVTWTGTDYGFRIKSGRDRGSDLSDMVLNNLKMTNVASPIYYTDYYTGQPKAGVDPNPSPVTATTPFVHDISVSNLTATGATSSEMVGVPEAPMRNITLNNVTIVANGTKSGGTKPNGTGMELRNVVGTFTNVKITPSSGNPFIVEEHVAVANNFGATLTSP